MEVSRQNQVGSGGDAISEPCRERQRRGADGPTAETAAVAAAAEIALAASAPLVAFERQAIEARLLARLAGRVDEEEAVVNDGRRAGAKLDGADPFVFREAKRDREVMVEVGAVGGDF